MMESKSENNGIACLSDQTNIYSVGISTGGIAEMRMAKLQPHRRIVATTIDAEGAQFAQSIIEKEGLSHQINVKIEDVAKPLPYEAQFFDFIYARLVLHYLPKASLARSLAELYRILKKNGQIFVVVRSAECKEAKEAASFDPETGFSSFHSHGNGYQRYFHTEQTIKSFLEGAGFSIHNIQTYEEQLCVDFMRKQPSSNIDVLIEVLASKS